MNFTARIALAVVILGGIALVAADVYGFLNVGDGRAASIVGLLAVGIWIAPSVMSAFRGNGSQPIVHIAIWLGIALALCVLYLWQEPILDALR